MGKGSNFFSMLVVHDSTSAEKTVALRLGLAMCFPNKQLHSWGFQDFFFFFNSVMCTGYLEGWKGSWKISFWVRFTAGLHLAVLPFSLISFIVDMLK